LVAMPFILGAPLAWGLEAILEALSGSVV
jgi:hypothetical protein